MSIPRRLIDSATTCHFLLLYWTVLLCVASIVLFFKMSLAHIKSRDTLVTCPYNPSHRITNGRFPTHINKCRKSHPNLDKQFVKCPFNASHIIPAIEKGCHIATCPDRVYVERQLVSSVKPSLNRLNQVPDYEDDLPKPSENWDAEASLVAGPGYDPSKQMNDQTFRNPATFASMTPAQKKQYRINQNRPFAEDEEQDDDDDDGVQSLIPSLTGLRMPRDRGMVEHSSPSSSTPNSFSRRDNDKNRMEMMLSISKGRGINRIANNLRPGQFASDSDNEGSQIGIVMKGRGINKVLSSNSQKVGAQKEKPMTLSNGEASFGQSDASFAGEDTSD